MSKIVAFSQKVTTGMRRAYFVVDIAFLQAELPDPGAEVRQRFVICIEYFDTK